MPLSNFTLFLSELTTEPWFAWPAGSSFRFEIPTTPCVSAVIGACALGWVSGDALLPPVEGDGVAGGADPLIAPGLPLLPLGVAVGAEFGGA